MDKAQTLEEKVRHYLTYSPDNKDYLSMKYFDELGREYSYNAVTKEIKRQEQEQK